MNTQTAIATQSPVQTPDQIRSAVTRAFDRAKRDRRVAYKATTNVYQVPSATTPGVEYTVSFTGPAYYQWHCTCPAHAKANVICACIVTAIYAKKHHISATRSEVSEGRAAVAEVERHLAEPQDRAMTPGSCFECQEIYAVDADASSWVERIFCPSCAAGVRAHAGK